MGALVTDRKFINLFNLRNVIISTERILRDRLDSSTAGGVVSLTNGAANNHVTNS